MTIKFSCPNPECSRIFEVHDERLVGVSKTSPNRQTRVTVPSAEVIALNSELSEIEAVVNEYEEKIKDGRISATTGPILEISKSSNSEIQRWPTCRYKSTVRFLHRAR
ncbi:MAG: hypothetical protein FWC50_03095 [Planctomycetaceae bacterium]|nr:hypothetical protein [Planctomycetaceae bacterium]